MYLKKEGELIRQGDIFQDFPTLIFGNFEVEMPFFVVLTQACDLEQDFENRNEKKETDDKKIQSVLVCPAYASKELKKGEHLSKAGLKMTSYSSNLWKTIKKNNNLRYHFLETNPDMGLPELIIDFKHYYTIPMESMYENKEYYLCSMDNLFKEDLSQRFASYLSRIGLPNVIDSSKSKESQEQSLPKSTPNTL